MANTATDEARRNLTESSLINEWTEEERLILATRAQAEATLALAYEQRTANLIALYTADGPLNIVDYGQLGHQIQGRLGL